MIAQVPVSNHQKDSPWRQMPGGLVEQALSNMIADHPTFVKRRIQEYKVKFVLAGPDTIGMYKGLHGTRKRPFDIVAGADHRLTGHIAEAHLQVLPHRQRGQAKYAIATGEIENAGAGFGPGRSVRHMGHE